MRFCSRVGKQVVTVPSFAVEKRNESHIDYDPRSTFAGGKPGRVAKKRLREGEKKEEEADS